MTRSTISLIVGLAAFVALTPTASHAAPCPVAPEVESTGDLGTTDERIEVLEQRIARGAHLSRAWALGWGVSLGLLAVGQVGIAPLVPRVERPEWWVGAGASTIGVLTRAVFRPRVLRERRLLAKEPSTGCERVAALEAALVRSAKWERQGRGLLMHGLSLGFNAGVGVFLGLVFDRPVAGNRLATIGGIVGEVMILTQPQYMSRTLDNYRVGAPMARFSSAPLVLRGGGGLSIRGRL